MSTRSKKHICCGCVQVRDSTIKDQCSEILQLRSCINAQYAQIKEYEIRDQGSETSSEFRELRTLVRDQGLVLEQLQVNSRIVMETNLKIVRTRNLLALRFLRDIARDNHGLLSPELLQFLPSRTQDTISGTRAAHEFCGSEIMDAVCSNVVSTEDARTSYLHILTVLRENELIDEVEEHSV